MAQTQSPTNEGYGELGKFVSGEAATVVKSVCCLKTTCTADETQTSAGVTKSSESGLTLVDADTVASSKTTVDNDTVQLDHKFTAGATATVKGFGIWNDDDDVLYALCCFNADVALESGDTLTVQMKMQFKKGS
jgi:hypothetical protein